MVEQNLEVDPEFARLLPPLSDEEKKDLEACLLSDGRCTDPIIYWYDGEKNLIVDGVHRWLACKRLNIPYRTEPMEFPSRTRVKVWILSRALGRRNLGNRVPARAARSALLDTLRSSGTPDPVAQAARAASVSPRTVRRDSQVQRIINELPNSLAQRIQSGALEASDADIVAVSRLTGQQKIAVARAVRVGQARSLREAIGLSKRVKRETPEAREPAKEPAGPIMPDHVARFASDGWYEASAKAILKVRSELLVHTANAYLQNVKDLAEKLAYVAEKLSEASFGTICPECQGKRCSWCRNMGWMPAWEYNNWKVRKVTR